MEKIRQLEQIARELEPDGAQRNELSSKAVAYVDQFVASLPHTPGFSTGHIDQLKALEIGTAKPLDQLLNILQEEVDAVGINSASGKHLGYIPGGGLWTSALADMLAAGTNRYAGIAYSSPGAVEIENQLIRWLTHLVGYPATAHGNLTSGGSTANMIAIKTARDFHQVNASNVKKSVVYFTDHTHHCSYKALHMTGLYEAVLRPIALNAYFQMDHLALQQQIESDIAEGLRPFLVIATTGTTHTGAIDPLEAIAAISKRHNLWLHVDAAYGGFFMLVDEMRERFKGIEQADSLVMDPHKTLFIPYGSGVVLVKDKQALLTSFSHTASYMKDADGVDEIDPADTGAELSRHFRGMRMWLPLHLHGVAPFKANLEEKLLLCRYFYEQIGKMGFETGPAPDLSVAIFRCANDDDNQNSEQLVKALHQDGRVFFSSTTINGKLWIRCAVVSFRTHLDTIDLALTMIKELSTLINHSTTQLINQ